MQDVDFAGFHTSKILDVIRETSSVCYEVEVVVCFDFLAGWGGSIVDYGSACRWRRDEEDEAVSLDVIGKTSVWEIDAAQIVYRHINRGLGG